MNKTVSMVILISTLFTDFAFASDIDGVWKSNCTERVITKIAFNSGNWNTEKTVHQDDSCTSAVYKEVISGKYIIKSSLAETGSYSIQFSNEKFSISPESASQASSFNSASFCGFNNWARNTAKDITTLDCMGHFPVGLMNFLIRITKTSQPTPYISMGLEGSTQSTSDNIKLFKE